jgi:hypothetical protein
MFPLRIGPLSWFLLAPASLVIAPPMFVQAQILDGRQNPHVFSDREALGVLFTIARNRQPGGWDIATRHKYLMEIGLSRAEAWRLIEAADAWFRELHPLDEELREIRRSAADRALDSALRQRANDLAARKLAMLDQHLAALRTRFGMEGAARLDQALLAVKRGMKAYVAGTPPERVRKEAGKYH